VILATTHSPQIIGEVKSQGLILLKQEDQRIIVDQEGLPGFGFDSNWILEHLMETESRNSATKQEIDMVEDALEEGNLDKAREHLQRLRQMMINLNRNKLPPITKY
jgi:hypothetical protein